MWKFCQIHQVILKCSGLNVYQKLHLWQPGPSVVRYPGFYYFRCNSKFPYAFCSPFHHGVSDWIGEDKWKQFCSYSPFKMPHISSWLKKCDHKVSFLSYICSPEVKLELSWRVTVNLACWEQMICRWVHTSLALAASTDRPEAGFVGFWVCIEMLNWNFLALSDCYTPIAAQIELRNTALILHWNDQSSVFFN